MSNHLLKHQDLLTKIYKYKFSIGEIVKHKSYVALYGEIIERGYNPVCNTYLIKSENGFTALYDENDLSIDLTCQRMYKLKEIGI